MKIFKLSVFFLAVIMIFSFVAVNAGEEKEPQGIQLVKQLWTDMKNADVESIGKYISPQFQSIHEDGTRNRDEQIELIKNLKMGEYALSDFCITENDSIIIVTYFVSVAETLEGEKLPDVKAARMSAWQKTDEGCKWIIHANLRAMK